MSKFKFFGVWLLKILLAILFTIQGIVKLGGSPAWVDRFRGWGYPDHFYFVVGLAEILGSILLLIPRTAKFGTLLLIVLMVGAAVTHVLHREPQVTTALVLIALLSLVLYLNRGAPASA